MRERARKYIKNVISLISLEGSLGSTQSVDREEMISQKFEFHDAFEQPISPSGNVKNLLPSA